MAYKFSLQAVLDARHMQVEAIEIEISRLQSLWMQTQAELNALRAHQHTLFERLRQKQAGTLDLTAIGHLRRNLKTVESDLALREAELNSLARQIDEQRRALVAARQDEETLDTLKQKEFERYQAALARQENRLWDDVNISRGSRRQVSPD